MPYEVEMPEGAKEKFEAGLKMAPAAIKKVAKKYLPWFLYRYEKANQYVLISEYSNNGTVLVSVLEKYNPEIGVERDVFGVNPSDLEACELPKHLSHLRPIH
jgi:hypothetical protein